MSLLTLIAATSFVAAPVPKEAPKAEGVEGEWKVVQFLHGGVPHNPEGPPATIVIKGNTMTVKERQCGDDVFALTLDPKASPATVDMREMRDGKPGELLPGIYLLEKDKLTICFSMGRMERPKEFKSVPGNHTGLLVIERVKK